jgi:hypothetical protein
MQQRPTLRRLFQEKCFPRLWLEKTNQTSEKGERKRMFVLFLRIFIKVTKVAQMLEHDALKIDDSYYAYQILHLRRTENRPFLQRSSKSRHALRRDILSFGHSRADKLVHLVELCAKRRSRSVCFLVLCTANHYAVFFSLLLLSIS